MSNRRDKGKKIWIDLENSPHVPFFKPIVNELENLGYTVFVTARDSYQVCGLVDQLGLRCKKIGSHYGKNKLMKIVGLGIRVMQLAPSIIREKPVLSLGHGSRSQLLLSYLLKVKSAWIVDYEHSAWLPLAGPDWLIAPEMIPESVFPVAGDRILKYPGIKEDVYVPGFRPEPGILRELGIGEKDLAVTIRPPASEAHYHNPESDKLFEATVQWLADIPGTRMILLPRSAVQTDFIRKTWPALIISGKIVIPESVVNGLNLIWFSDLVVSGGGTMNREAAALGAPVYSIFRGKIGAVDRYLSDKGRLVLLETPEDMKSKVVLKKWARPPVPEHENLRALETIVRHIDALVGKSRR